MVFRGLMLLTEGHLDIYSNATRIFCDKCSDKLFSSSQGKMEATLLTVLSWFPWVLNRFSQLEESFTNVKPPRSKIHNRKSHNRPCLHFKIFTDVSFIKAFYGKKRKVWSTGGFFALNQQVATRPEWKQGWAAPCGVWCKGVYWTNRAGG